jgi:dolichol kinase
MDSDFGALVERTAGPQPWRRLFHACNGLAIAGVLSLLPLSRAVVLGVLTAITVALAGLDALRLHSGRANQLFFLAFPHLLSPREAAGPASSSWYALGVLLAVALFPLPAAVSGVLVLGLGDPAASYVGRRWGRVPFLGGSAEGTATFLLVALLVLGVRHPVGVAIGAAVAATLAERLSWPLDDNLTIPVVSAGALFILEQLL